jgi:hypothetical protein
MRIPEFTAEVSLDPAGKVYRTANARHREGSGVNPSGLTAFAAIAIEPGRFRWPISEPNCIRICLPSWGGHCRWICF